MRPHSLLRHCALATVILALASAAGADADLHERIVLNSRKDNAEGADMLVRVIEEAARRAGVAKGNVKSRRGAILTMVDAQDVIVKFVSPEAMRVFGAYLSRLTGDAAVTLCEALKSCPPDAGVDAAAASLLRSGMDPKLRTALTDLLGAHHYALALNKIALGLNPLESPSIQIASCRALGLIPDKKSIPFLLKYMAALTGSGGRYRYEATAALRALSGENLVPNAGVWKDWWEKNEKTFAVDASKPASPDFNFEMSEKQDMSYYEVPVVENRLVIVLDCSGSMTMGAIASDPKTKTLAKPNRFESAKKELKAFINSLNEKQLFNIVCYSTSVRRWQKLNGLVPANEANKKNAIMFLEYEKPSPGTQTALAMEDALLEISTMHGCETIYLVTDGSPNPWDNNITPELQERLIRWLNAPLKIRINTIGIFTVGPKDPEAAIKGEEPEKMSKFLIDIAANNDGVYREVDREGMTKIVKFDPKKEQAMKEEKEKDEKEKAAKAAKEKEEKEKLAAKDAPPKDAAAKDPKDTKEEEPKPLEIVPREVPPKKVDPPKKDETEVARDPKEKDLGIPIVIEPRKDAPKKPDDKTDSTKKPAKKTEETE